VKIQRSHLLLSELPEKLYPSPPRFPTASPESPESPEWLNHQVLILALRSSRLAMTIMPHEGESKEKDTETGLDRLWLATDAGRRRFG